MQDWVFTICVDDIDLSLLPEGCRTPGTPEFSQAVSRYVETRVQGLGGSAEVLVEPDTITVTWSPDGEGEGTLRRLASRLAKGKEGAGFLLKLLLGRKPMDADTLCNLGMALSDAGAFGDAEACLRKTLSVAPGHVKATVALGVALNGYG